MYKALLVEEIDGEFKNRIVEKELEEVEEGKVRIRVKYSSVNYKDALSISGNKGVTRNYPHTPGIDAAGVVEVGSGEFKVGDNVVVTGFDLGMNTFGGFSEYIVVPEAWVVRLPETLTLREAMEFGTAGLTAAISVDKLVNLVPKESGKILVTGGTGGVATMAIKMLSKLGYYVVAATSKLESKDELLEIGASEVIDASELRSENKRLMLKPLYAGVIDTVGGNVLANAIKSVGYDGVVTACGNIGGVEFMTNVFPFILKGVSLLGVDSVEYPRAKRDDLWKRMGTIYKPEKLNHMTYEITLNEIDKVAKELLSGKHIGRAIVKL